MKKLRKILRNWLGVAVHKPETTKELEKFREEQGAVITKLERELDYWKRTFRSYSRIPCAHCGKQMHVYPYGGAYYTHSGVKVHAECYDDYLKLASLEPKEDGDERGAGLENDGTPIG